MLESTLQLFFSQIRFLGSKVNQYLESGLKDVQSPDLYSKPSHSKVWLLQVVCGFKQ